jgi:hypothetical protein
MTLHMMAKDVDIFGMYLVMKQTMLRNFTNCDIPNMSIKWWLKCTLTYILKIFTVTFPICQLNDD